MLVCRIYGANDLRVETTPQPFPGPGEVLVRLGAGGICGSDLHYFRDGRLASFEIREPLVPGHEASGTIVAVGDGAIRLKPGERVAISPSHACGQCEACRSGRENLCARMIFLGSASVFPHGQGLLRDYFVVAEHQCYSVSEGVSLSELAFAEPLAVALHAVNRAGSLMGASVLVTGGGPIGCLIVLAAKLGGAQRIACSDILDRPLQAARTVGADEVIRADCRPETLAGRRFDVALEASGSFAALRNCLSSVRRGGVIVQVGNHPAEPPPFALNEIVMHEIDLRGVFRWGREFEWAVRYLESRKIDVRPLLSSQFPLREARAAFECAEDKSKSIKVQLISAED